MLEALFLQQRDVFVVLGQIDGLRELPQIAGRGVGAAKIIDEVARGLETPSPYFPHAAPQLTAAWAALLRGVFPQTGGEQIVAKYRVALAEIVDTLDGLAVPYEPVMRALQRAAQNRCVKRREETMIGEALAFR